MAQSTSYKYHPELSPPQDPTVANTSTDPFGDLMSLIRTHSSGRFKVSFENVRQYRGFLKGVFEECVKGGPVCGHYCGVTNVDPGVFNKISHIHTEICKSSCATYDNVKKQLIVKFMPGVAHDTTGMELYLLVRDTIGALPGHDRFSIRSMATSRFTVPGLRSKEGDQGLKPATRIGPLEWPSLVIEV